MAKKSVQSPAEVYSSSDAIRLFEHLKDQGHNVNIKKVGNVQYEIEVPGKGSIHLNDNCRTLPKEQRNVLRFWIFCLLGSVVAAIVTIPLWLPEVLKLVSG